MAQSKNIVYSNSFEIEELSAIEINLNFEELLVSQIYGSEITIEVGSNNLNKIPQIKTEEGVLKIESAFKQGSSQKGQTCCVYIYIPQDFNPQYIKLLSQTGNIQAQILKAVTAVCVQSAFGRIDVQACNTEFLEIKNSSGDSRVQKLLCDYFEFYSEKGIIFVELEKAPQAQSFIKNESGKTQLYYPNTADLFIDVKTPSETYIKQIGQNGPGIKILGSQKNSKVEIKEY
ncbi:MAG: DUF4097 family beta strand repeat-containing protein [Treponema sp.]|nr:DUF4097 family beta strand repeat-containing protein [Treponema sp.]